MDKELKAKWVKALRSGEYQQGRLNLKFMGAYCCLGVLAEVAKVSPPEDAVYIYDDSENCMFLEHEVQKGLASMNDHGVPFEMIAGFIQENL